MTDRAQLQADLIRDEGVVLSAYEDSEGFLTIGVGRLIDPRRGGGITYDEALYLLGHDIERVQRQLLTALPWLTQLDAARQRVLLNMAFNLGVSGLLGFKETLQAVRHGNYSRAAERMLHSKWAAQVGARATRLAALMKNG